ncbi:MAG TPA: family 10 glycosylhydrolase [Armatimonadota bacterium]|jgi:hypothetical protein
MRTGAGSLSVRGIWCGAEDFGRTPESAAEYAQRLSEARINLVAVCVKGSGTLFWPSRLHPEAVADAYREIDLPAEIVKACRQRGIQVHAWFIDFMESASGPAFTGHPEWAMRNAAGETTASETLRGQPYHSVWMCPARRPGYADQWLIPLMREFAERYDVDAIHHDYIRYPGDLAPDQYCFCDHCLRELPRYAGYVTEAFPDEAFPPRTYDRPYLEAHWEPGPRVLPPDWNHLPRARKSAFLLEGGFFEGGRRDLDYFFYLYRVDAIQRFAREAAAAIREARPGMAISAAVFKNPIHSGRFIGQDWRRFPPHVDIAMPMDYRDHFPGDFDTYLTLLEESVASQKAWACGYRALWPGVAANFLYFEEERPLRRIAAALDEGGDIEDIRPALDDLPARLREFAPDLNRRLNAFTGEDAPGLAGAVRAFLDAPPPGYRSPEKMERAIACIRDTGAEGICIFSGGLLTRYDLWDAVGRAFTQDA